MRSGALLAAVAMLWQAAYGQSLRRMRRVVEVSDLAVDFHHEVVSQSYQHKQEEELAIAQREIYRLLHSDYSSDSSMQMSMPSPTNPPAPNPTSAAPVSAETPAPVLSADTTAPATALAPVAAETPAPVEPPAPKTRAPIVAKTAAPSPIGTQAPVETPVPVDVETRAPTVPKTAAPSPIVTQAPVSAARDAEIQEKCSMTAVQRSRFLFSIVSEFSDEDDLINPDSPRSQTLNWIDNVDPALLCPITDRVSQRYKVALIYFALDGSEWFNCGVDSTECINTDAKVLRAPLRWLIEENECFWYGLFCDGMPDSIDPKPTPDENFVLTVIDVPDNNLGGQIPIEIFSLTTLQILTMDGNRRIEGSIPPEIGNMSALTVLDMDLNKLTGSLPDELYALTNLGAIDLNNNQLVGSISGQIGNLRDLKVLQLENNQMTGAVPTAGLFLLERMGTLQLVHLSYYALSCSNTSLLSSSLDPREQWLYGIGRGNLCRCRYETCGEQLYGISAIFPR